MSITSSTTNTSPWKKLNVKKKKKWMNIHAFTVESRVAKMRPPVLFSDTNLFFASKQSTQIHLLPIFNHHISHFHYFLTTFDYLLLHVMQGFQNALK